jgi:hypothetical protein
MTWFGVITGSALLALTGHESTSLSTAFQRLHQTFREQVLAAGFMAAEAGAGVEFLSGDQWRIENDGI